MDIWWIVAAMALLAFVIGALIGSRVRAAWRHATFAKARQEFRRQREHLEARFFQLAAASGMPRGLRWTQCDFDDDVAFARDRETGDLLAFVGVSIGFAAIEGGGMEEVEAVEQLRAATAVFQYTGAWRTDGRVIFNLNPTEAIDRFHANLETVADEPSA